MYEENQLYTQISLHKRQNFTTFRKSIIQALHKDVCIKNSFKVLRNQIFKGSPRMSSINDIPALTLIDSII